MAAFERPGARGDGVSYPLGLYARAIDESDYVATVAPLVRALVPDRGDMIDIGAGGGQIGGALRMPSRRWTAIEPASVMQARLAAHASPPDVIPCGWREVDDLEPADTVFAATMPAYLTDAPAFLEQCKSWAKRHIVWVVPAQSAPRGLILAACLPREWHGEDETPGIDLVLPALSHNPPHAMQAADWTFSLTLPDLSLFANWQADRLGWPDADARRPALFSHLSRQAVETPNGFRLSCWRRSAVLVWNL